MLDLIYILLGLCGLFFGGNWLVRGASRFAASLGISPLIVGLTVVAVGTSMPELMVSLSAALQGSPDITTGNVIGSNIANIGLILGITGLITPMMVEYGVIRREIPMMIGVSFLTYLLMLDYRVTRVEGVLLLLGYGLFTLWIYRSASKRPRDEASRHAQEDIASEIEDSLGDTQQVNRLRELGFVALGVVTLVVGAQLTVEGAVSVARQVGISELIIGLTLVAVGTSLPELVTSIMAAWHKHNDLAIGNVVGSNIANLLVILGATAAISPISVDRQLIALEFPVMLGFSVVLLPFVLDLRLSRPQAGALLLGYGTFTAFTLIG